MRFGLLLFFLLVFNGISFAQTVSVKTSSAPLLSSPSQDGSYPLLKMPHYYPLYVLAAKGDYYRTQDFRKRVGWVEKSQVDTTRTAVVSAKEANVRKGPGTDHPVVFRAYAGVTFKVLAEKGNWLEVQHESGRKGWIFKSLVWGW